jgi:hypothetical protein
VAGVARCLAAGAGVGVVDAFCRGADVVGLLGDAVARGATVGAGGRGVAKQGPAGFEAGLVDLDLAEGLVELNLGWRPRLGGAAGGEEEKEEEEGGG